MAKKESTTLHLPTKQAPAVKPLAIALGTTTAPTAEEVKKAAEEKRHAEAITAFGKAADAATAALVDKIGGYAAKMGEEQQAHNARMLTMVAELVIDGNWVRWDIYKLVAGYIEAKFGNYARTCFRIAYAARCEQLSLKMPTSSGEASGNADKGKSPARKYSKAARSIDNAIAAVAEFYATLKADAPSLKHWTTVMAQLTAQKVEMQADSKNADLKKSA